MEKLYNDYFQTVFKYLFSLTFDRELAEELTQETFCQAIRSYDRFRGDCKVSTWLCQIAKYLLYGEKRHRGKMAVDPYRNISEDLPAKDNVEKQVLANESKVSLYQRQIVNN